RRRRLHHRLPRGADDARREDHPDLRGHQPDPAHGDVARAAALSTPGGAWAPGAGMIETETVKRDREQETVQMQKVGVIGGGTMGAGIAEVCAKAGSTVTVLETKAEFAEAAKGRLDKSIGRGVKAGKLSQEDADAALGRISVTLEMADLADCDLVIEAAPEIE